MENKEIEEIEVLEAMIKALSLIVNRNKKTESLIGRQFILNEEGIELTCDTSENTIYIVKKEEKDKDGDINITFINNEGYSQEIYFDQIVLLTTNKQTND